MAAVRARTSETLRLYVFANAGISSARILFRRYTGDRFEESSTQGTRCALA
jgi:hypothetical protein